MNRSRSLRGQCREQHRGKRRTLAAIHKATVYALAQWGLTFADLIAFDVYKRR